jgi:hypothetical protein
MLSDVVDITVGVGDGVKKFKIHKGALCHYSGYFDRALNGKFAEAQTAVIDLPEEEAKIVEYFTVWLYTGDIICVEEDNYEDICKLWMFADRRDVPLLMNKSMDTLRDAMVLAAASPSRDVPLIYANTTEGPALRRFAIEVCSRTGRPETLDDVAHWPQNVFMNWSQQALLDVLALVWKPNEGEDKMSAEELAAMDMCRFHQHEQGVSCAKNDSEDSGY